MKANQWDRSGKNNPMFEKTHNLDSRRKMSKRQPKIRKLHSDETKRKMRISAIEYLKRTTGCSPRYNKDACKFFDYINSIFNLNGKHGENCGEYYVKELGYWLDYIDFDAKLIIENNERKHYNIGRRNNKTELKEREIRKYFNDYEFVITKIPRAGKYDKERLDKIFKREIERIIARRERIFTRRN